MYKITCYIKSLDSDGAVTVCGTDGCYVEHRDSQGALNKCNIYWLYGADKIRSADDVLKVNASSNLFQMLLTAKAENLKVELGILFDGNEIYIERVFLI